MASRAALYLMPGLAVLATAALVLGPGRERPAIGARVWGDRRAQADRVAWRLETIERQFGADRAVAVEGIEVVARREGGQTGRWSGSTDAEGIAEVALALPGASKREQHVELSVTRPGGPLAVGRIDLHWHKDTLVWLEPRSLEGKQACVPDGCAPGGLALQVELARGVLAAPFPGTVLVRFVRRPAPGGPEEALPGWKVRATAAGATVDPAAADLRTDERGEAAVRLTPTFHSVELKVEAMLPEPGRTVKVTWEGDVPVVPGALWLDAGERELRVLSPVPRDRAYVSGFDLAANRTFGAVVPLAKTDAGLFEGSLPRAEVLASGAAVLTVAGDVREQGAGTVTWPLSGTEAVRGVHAVDLLFDGVPHAEALEKKRAGKARLASVAVALVAGLFEAVLLVLYSRASQARLAAHLARVAEDDEADRAAAARIADSPASRAFSLVVAVGLVVLAFGAVAAFAIVR